MSENPSRLPQGNPGEGRRTQTFSEHLAPCWVDTRPDTLPDDTISQTRGDFRLTPSCLGVSLLQI